MPFTFAHPAIVLPLARLSRRWFSLTGLIIGSLTPDFEYFLRMRLAGHLGHSIMGIFVFDLPIGLLLTFLFHNVVRDALFENLPAPLASRVRTFKNFNWNLYFRRYWFLVITSIVIGAVSHILWDSFTHENGFFVKQIPSLAGIVSLGHLDVQAFRVLQHASTLIGAIAIAYYIWSLPRIKTKVPIRNKYWVVMTGIILAIVIIRLLTGLDYYSPGNVVVNMISAGLIALVLTPLIINETRIPER